MKKLKTELMFLISFIVSIFIIYLLYSYTHPYAGVKIIKNQKQIEDNAQEILNFVNIDQAGLNTSLNLMQNDDLIRYIQRSFGIKKANEYLRAGVPGYYYRINWSEGIQINFGGDDNEQNAGDEWNPIKSLTLDFDTRGNIIELKREIPDTIKFDLLSESDARNYAMKFLSKFTDLESLFEDSTNQISSEGKRIQLLDLQNGNENSSNAEQTENQRRTDYVFNWAKDRIDLNTTLNVKISVSGNTISNLELAYDIPQIDEENAFYITRLIILTLMFFAATLIGLFVGFKRLRAYELGFKLALGIGIIFSLIFGLVLYFQTAGHLGLDILIMIFITPLFYGVGILILWAISESIARDVWQEKFSSIDLIAKGHLIHSLVGKSIINGISIGGIVGAVMLILVWLSTQIFSSEFVVEDSELLKIFNSSVPTIYLIANTMAKFIYAFVFFPLLILALVKRKIRSDLASVLIVAILFGLFYNRQFSPDFAGFLIHTVVGLIVIGAFIKYDTLTSFVSLISFYIIINGMGLFYNGQSNVTFAGFSLIGIFLVLYVFGFFTMVTKNPQVDLNTISPGFVQFINERQRMQRELEIARDVQMGFLPNEMPEINGLEIAAQCIPALEVGGDYYDFIPLNSNKLGIAIGDVSGKGTQAAFYMTLTKGFLKATAENMDLATEVLVQVNKLFFENAKRNTFISMVYGIFDLDVKSLALARAGHNPVIMHQKIRGEVQEIQSEGLALGLDSGSTFDDKIQEVNISFEKGDVFVFYTDGLTEAMNNKQEEYGQERLVELIDGCASKSPQEIKDLLYSDVKKFIGKSEQHDDMSVVVVKIA